MPHKGSNESQIPQKSFENCHQCCQGHQKESKGSKEKFERKRKSSLDEGENFKYGSRCGNLHGPERVSMQINDDYLKIDSPKEYS